MDLFTNGSQERLEALGQELTLMWSTLAAILVVKGIATDEEILQMRLSLLPKVEQELAAVKERIIREWREDNPEQAKTVDFFNKLLGMDTP